MRRRSFSSRRVQDLDVEFFDGAQSVVAERGLVFGQVRVEFWAERVAFGREVLHPVVHDLSVAEDAEAAEELARDAAHLGPGGIGIDFLKDGADGAAAADGDAQIVNRIGSGILADGFKLPEDALHRFAEVALGNRRGWDGDDGKQCLRSSMLVFVTRILLTRIAATETARAPERGDSERSNGCSGDSRRVRRSL